MMRGTTYNYSNRTVDLELLQTTESVRTETPLSLSLAKDTTRSVSGIQKAIQRYTVLLLTDLGSVRFMDVMGSNLMTSLAQGRVHDRARLEHLIVDASYRALDLLQAERANEPEDLLGKSYSDEVIVSADVSGVNLDYTAGIASATISITTEAGEEYEFIVPVRLGM